MFVIGAVKSRAKTLAKYRCLNLDVHKGSSDGTCLLLQGLEPFKCMLPIFEYSISMLSTPDQAASRDTG